MRRAYRLLLRLYPHEHRLQFAEEMFAVFTRVAEERRAQGWFAYACFAVSECIGLLGDACGEWPKCMSFAPALGGIAAAAVLHTAFYAVTRKILHGISASVCILPPADPRAAGLTLAIFGMAIPLCLLPVLVLLSMRLNARGR
jgi:hypothetical protein